MVIAGKVKRAAFYCRMNHRDRNYSQFNQALQRILNQKYGNGNWEMKIFHEIASGTDPNRKKFNQLKTEIKSGNWDVVVTLKADTIARDWKQFIEFMELCENNNVEVICIHALGSAYPLFERIKQFKQDYFEGSGGH